MWGGGVGGPVLPPAPQQRRRRRRRSSAEFEASVLRTSRRLEEYKENLAEQAQCSIHPDERWHTLWDLVMVALLCFVAVATPVEVAFFSSEDSDGAGVATGNDESAASAAFSATVSSMGFGGLPLSYWAWNRVIDVLFVADLVMNFFLGFEDEVEGTVVRDIRVIAARYVRTWFTVDLVSVLPFFVFEEDFLRADAAVSEDTLVGVSGERLGALQIVRLARVLKIVRLLRASRILKRWEDRFSIRSTVLYPATYIVVLIFVIHCMACVFELSSNLAVDERQSWETVYLGSDQAGVAGDVLTKYLSALYWSCMTVTTIGYGDLTPTNVAEEWICITIMFLGSCIYAFLVGTIVSSLSGGDPAGQDYQRDVENLDDLTKAAGCSRHHRHRLQDFFSKRGQPVYQYRYFSAVLELCSPGIRACFVQHLYSASLLALGPFQRPAGVAPLDYAFFLGEMAVRLQAEAFPANEMLVSYGQLSGGDSKLFVLRRGLVGSQGRVFNRGSVLGADITAKAQRRRYTVRTLTFVDAVTLRSRDLHALLDAHPSRLAAQRLLVRKFALRVALRNTLHEVASRLKRVSMLAALVGVDVDVDVDDLLPSPAAASLGVSAPALVEARFDAAAVVRRALERKVAEAEVDRHMRVLEEVTEGEGEEDDGEGRRGDGERTGGERKGEERNDGGGNAGGPPCGPGAKWRSHTGSKKGVGKGDRRGTRNPTVERGGGQHGSNNSNSGGAAAATTAAAANMRTRRRRRQQGRRQRHELRAAEAVEAAEAAHARAREHEQRLRLCRRICRLQVARLTPRQALAHLWALRDEWAECRHHTAPVAPPSPLSRASSATSSAATSPSAASVSAASSAASLPSFSSLSFSSAKFVVVPEEGVAPEVEAGAGEERRGAEGGPTTTAAAAAAGVVVGLHGRTASL